MMSGASRKAMAATAVTTVAATGPAKYHQWGWRSRTMSSPSLSSLRGNGTTGERRGAAAASPVHLATEHRCRRAHPIEEQQAVEVVDLVLHRPGLEGVGV